MLEFYPKTEDKLQEYALAQIEHLNRIRQLKHHLHPANYTQKSTLKTHANFEVRADVESDLVVDYKIYSAKQIKTEVETKLESMDFTVLDM